MIEVRLLNGETGEACAKTIKLEWGLMPNHKLLSLAKILTNYRQERLIGKLLLLKENLDNPHASPRLVKFAEKVDVLENLTKLVEIQQTRVTKGVLGEEQLGGMLDRKMRYEIEVLGNLYARLATLQMDLGLIRKVPAKLQIEGMASRTQQVLQDAMSRSRRVDEALTKAFQVLEGKFQTVDDPKNKH
jgi:hypothetical protein